MDPITAAGIALSVAGLAGQVFMGCIQGGDVSFPLMNSLVDLTSRRHSIHRHCQESPRGLKISESQAKNGTATTVCLE